MDQGISEKIQAIALDLEKFKSITNSNNEEISELYNKIEKVNTIFTELKIHVNNLIDHVHSDNDNIKENTKNLNNLNLTIAKIISTIENLNDDIKEISDKLKNHIEIYTNHAATSSSEFEKFRNNENIMNTALNDLKSDIADLEQSINEFTKNTNNRLTKLEEVKNGYKVLKWIGGIIAGMLGFLLLAYEFYEKILKHVNQ